MKRNSLIKLKSASILIGIIVGLLSSLVTINHILNPQHMMNNAENDETEDAVEVSWVIYFSNLRELVTNSDVIILGKVIDARTIIRTIYEPWGTKDIGTAYKFEVEQVIKGDLRVGEVIGFALSGGIINGKPRMVIREDPLANVGERLILFLKRTEGGFAIQGPWGRFIVISNKVYSLGAIYLASKNYSLDVNGTNLEEFIKEIQVIMTTFYIG